MKHRSALQNHKLLGAARLLVPLALLGANPHVTAQDRAEEAKGGAEWQRDLLAFDRHVKAIAAKARVPTAEEFMERAENAADEDLEFSVMPGVGVVDLKPPEGTVQFVLNEALKGKVVRWEMELAVDDERFGGALLSPKRLIGPWVPWFKAEPRGKPPGKDAPLVWKVQLADEPDLATRLFAGQRILVEGTLAGLPAWHNWGELPKELPLPIIFWAVLVDAKVTRLDPTVEQLKDQILSDKADLDRNEWKVLEVNGGTEFDGNAVGRAFDSDFDTAWQMSGEEGQPKHPHSLLVDMGREEIVAGLRYAPPGAPRDGESISGPGTERTGGKVGKFSLHVSDSRDEMGPPVSSGTFTNYQAEHEVAFPEVKGRYFKFVVHSAADGASRTALAELNLLAPAVEISDPFREPALPPMAEEFERFALLYGKLRALPEALELPEDHPNHRGYDLEQVAEPWWNLKGEIYGMAARIAQGEESVEEAIYRAAEMQAPSQFGWANVLTVAAHPRFSSDEQREEMAALARIMKAKRLQVLAAIKRTLSVPQQEKLKSILSTLLPTPPRPRSRPTTPVRTQPQAQAKIDLDEKGAGTFLEMLPVGNAGNEADRLAPFGVVDYSYAIGKYEVTNDQYAEFLNAVAATDPNALYHEKMGSDRDGGIVRKGEPGSYRYSVKEHRGNKPVVFVNWFDALRFCNWLHNGRPGGGQDRNTTEAGAYTLTGATRIGAGTDPTHGEHGRNDGARFWLPSENEWYKAAYHNPGPDGKSAPKFWLYPTKSDQVPSSATADETGNINNDTGNIANAPQPDEEGDDVAPLPPAPVPPAPVPPAPAPSAPAPPAPAPPAPAPPAPAPPAPEPAKSNYPIAKPIPDKPGFVFNPFTNNPVDVRAIPAGSLVRDPQDPNPEHKFHVPAPSPSRTVPSRTAPSQTATKLTTVGSGGPGSESSYGAADMAGNVEEWTQDIRGKGRMWIPNIQDYVAISDHVGLSDVLDPSVTNRIARGGSWSSPSLRSIDREELDPVSERSSVGFRVAGHKPCPGPLKKDLP